ncbi:Transmembrane transcriptional regulator (anti-sigma factor RsiW) [Paenibacillus sp. UNC496MF]|uniref:zf-HC2 domain-containing protein n=1 Tax=Paenibacillus sp. UNC496MF TaxID=1502753 RepID=UPI0008ECDF1E|nr:zf-HC2 domain-containing protein [Paenibacillus sp. UNC496MF]SFJ92083.1 Transmembrane transcriptional regulator (anti-sigma factor RsiW) [Paenibacillus sp. UNC496MF]
MNCNVAVMLMHDYLDDELPHDDLAGLKAHLDSCPSCRARMEQLERTEALAHRMMDTHFVISAEQSSQLTQRIMDALPAKRRRPASGFTRWVRNHPAVSVAAVFVLVMFSSFLAMWQQDSQLAVRGPDLAEVVINGDTVTVPAGAHVNGDLTVENGKANVLGEVDGDVTVISGSLYEASTAHISGEVKQIDQALDWFWYKVTTSISSLAY